MSVLVLGEADVAALLTMPECIDRMHRLFATLASGNFVQPLRTIAWQPDRRGGVASMPAFVGSCDAIGAKLITVFPENRRDGLDSHQGVIALHETKNGRLLAIVHAGAITQIRTAAVSGVATRLLARSGACDLAMLGSGAQARSHLQAMLAVRPIRRLRVWSRTSANAHAFGHWAAQLAADVDVHMFNTPEQAVRGADLICAVSASTQPIVRAEWVQAGAHINAAGASVPGFRELDHLTLATSRLFVDLRESALAEADDLRTAIAAGIIEETHIAGDLAELASARITGRRDERETTIFKSCGLAIEDLAAAAYVYERAIAEGAGSRAQW
jgi:ornithine cyclodeaminase/alanine dehydrogenase-like protein (mu-crystallin family)